MIPAALPKKFLPLLAALSALMALVLATTASGASSSSLTYGELPDPLQRGSFTVNRVDPLKLGTLTYEEPNGKGGSATGSNESLTTRSAASCTSRKASPANRH